MSLAHSLTGSASKTVVSFSTRNPTRISMQAFSETAARIEMPAASNLYQVLNLKTSASATEIKSAYRSLAKRFHPDTAEKHGNDSRDFIEIRNAYMVLSDPTAKARYDMSIGSAGTQRVGYASSDFVGQSYRTTKRWETDQCW